jgi:hypothetical protein
MAGADTGGEKRRGRAVLRPLIGAVLWQAWKDVGRCPRVTCKENCEEGEQCNVPAFWRSEDCQAMCLMLDISYTRAIEAVQRRILSGHNVV